MVSDTKAETGPTLTQTSLEKGNVDDAWSFLNKHYNSSLDTDADIDALRRKVDWHIVPLMFGCYTMQFLDKVILNVSCHDLGCVVSGSDYLLVRRCHGHPKRPSTCW